MRDGRHGICPGVYIIAIVGIIVALLGVDFC